MYPQAFELCRNHPVKTEVSNEYVGIRRFEREAVPFRWTENQSQCV